MLEIRASGVLGLHVEILFQFRAFDCAQYRALIAYSSNFNPTIPPTLTASSGFPACQQAGRFIKRGASKEGPLIFTAKTGSSDLL